MGKADAGWRELCVEVTKAKFEWWLLPADEGGRPSDQTPSDGSERSGYYLLISAIGGKVSSLVQKFPRVRTFRNFLVNISVLAC